MMVTPLNSIVLVDYYSYSYCSIPSEETYSPSAADDKERSKSEETVLTDLTHRAFHRPPHPAVAVENFHDGLTATACPPARGAGEIAEVPETRAGAHRQDVGRSGEASGALLGQSGGSGKAVQRPRRAVQRSRMAVQGARQVE